MPRTAKSQNKSQYSWYVHGSICGAPVDKKYCSLTGFLDDYGGDRTVLNLNKSKLMRLKRKWEGNTKKPEYCITKERTDAFFAKHWNVHFTPIREKRVCKVVYE